MFKSAESLLILETPIGRNRVVVGLRLRLSQKQSTRHNPTAEELWVLVVVLMHVKVREARNDTVRYAAVMKHEYSI